MCLQVARLNIAATAVPEPACHAAGSLLSQLRLLLPGLAGTAVPALEALSSSPSVPAALLCAFALAAPSLLSTGVRIAAAGVADGLHTEWHHMPMRVQGNA